MVHAFLWPVPVPVRLKDRLCWPLIPGASPGGPGGYMWCLLPEVHGGGSPVTARGCRVAAALGGPRDGARQRSDQGAGRTCGEMPAPHIRSGEVCWGLLVPGVCRSQERCRKAGVGLPFLWVPAAAAGGVATEPSSGDTICSGCKAASGGDRDGVSTGLWPRAVTQHCWVLLDTPPVGPAVLLGLQEGGATLSQTT